MKYFTRVNDQEYEIEIDRENEIVVDGRIYTVDFQRPSDTDPVSLLLNNRSIAALVEDRDDHWEVLINGELYNVTVQDERSYRLSQARATLDGDGDVVVRSPMPGLILSVLVEEGRPVQKGDKVVILESMKMENELRAGRDGMVLHIRVSPGETVEKDQPLVIIGDAPEE